MSLFSAIITTRNRKELLEKAIESVLSQTVKDVECVVVDDASEDGTKETYEKDPRIVYVRIDAKDSRGGNYARNQGIAHATGEFLTFLDDDDTWASDKLEKQLALYQKHPGSVIFCGRTFRKVIDGNVQLHTVIPPKKFTGDISRLIRMTYVTSTSCLFFPRTLLEKVGNFDTELCAEFFQSFVREAGVTLHLRQLAGENSHHIIEACFKAFARALADAVRIDENRRDSVPSTKGVLG